MAVMKPLVIMLMALNVLSGCALLSSDSHHRKFSSAMWNLPDGKGSSNVL